MNTNTATESGEQQSDRLLWFAAAAVVGLGLLWLLISQPWSSGTTSTVSSVVVTTPAAAPEPITAAPAAPDGSGRQPRLGDPLRMAQLAYDAGMLVEPEDYSAWTLYTEVLAADPSNTAAQQGLQKVAADLLQRGSVALEQGRYADVRATVNRILAALPEHAAARELGARLAAAEPKPLPPPSVPVIAPRPEPKAAAAAPSAPTIAPEPKVDPIVAAHEAFGRAMAENRVLTPAGDSAKHYVEVMIRTQPSHALARQDRNLLVTELLARSTQALEALDTEGARTWIDEAERLTNDPAQIAAARGAWTDRLIAMESAKPIPASALVVRNYTAPTYPRTAASRGQEGWVDLEFTVTTEGTTRDVRVSDASHDRMFRDEAIAAVEQWRFEPRVFMDRPIEQRSYTRVRFVLAN